MAFLGRLLGCLAAFPSLDILVNSCEIHSTDSLSGSAFTIGSPPLFGVVSLTLGLLTYWNFLILTWSCTGRQSLRSASRGDFVVPHARTAIKQHRAFSIVGSSAWNSLASEIRSLPRDLSSSFYQLLKTFIFTRGWCVSALCIYLGGAIYILNIYIYIYIYIYISKDN